MSETPRKAANGEGRPYFIASKGLWCAPFTLDGKRHYAYSRDEGTAVAKRDQMRARLLAGRAAKDSRIRLRAFFEAWERDVLPHSTTRKRRPLADGTRNTYASAIRSHVVPLLGDRPLIAIVERDSERVFIRMKEKGYSSSYLNTTHKALLLLFRDAKKAGHLERIPLQDVVAPLGTPTKDKVVPTTAQLQEMLAAADPKMRAFIATTAFLGLRISEALGITWADYDSDGGTLTVTGKGDKSRTIVVGVALRKELEAWRREQNKLRMASPWWSPDDYMLSSSVGTRWDNGNCRKAFERVGRPILPGCTPHSLRHYAATRLMEAGVTTEIISKHLGHADTSVTSKVYLHVSQELLGEVADAMDRVIGR